MYQKFYNKLIKFLKILKNITFFAPEIPSQKLRQIGQGVNEL